MKKITFAKLFSFLIYVIFVADVQAYNILLLHPFGSKSQKIFFMAMLTPLAEKGHNVTLVTSFKPKKKVGNLKEITVIWDSWNEFFGDPVDDGPLQFMYKYTQNSPEVCVSLLADPQIQALKKESFDLLMISSDGVFDCFLSLVHHFKVPFVYTMTDQYWAHTNVVSGIPNFPSLVPNSLLDFSFPMTFYRRVQNALMEVIVDHLIYTGSIKAYKLCKERNLCPADMPHISEMMTNASLFINNGIQLLQFPVTPSVSNTINIGGIHCNPANALPKELEEWLSDTDEHGFIYFSLGSLVTTDSIPIETLDVFISAFGKLKQKIVWKWDSAINNLPPNVKVSKWLPQQDLLGHKNIRLFISHGGIFSLYEATYHNCPVLGIPIFLDQLYNIQQAEAEGYAKTLTLDAISEETLLSTINEIINEKSYRDVVKKRSQLMSDRLNSPAEEVVYWVEYVIRHNGADHLKSPIRNMSTIVLYNIDVWATVGTTIAGFFLVVWIILRKCLQMKTGFKKQSIKKKKIN